MHLPPPPPPQLTIVFVYGSSKYLETVMPTFLTLKLSLIKPHFCTLPSLSQEFLAFSNFPTAITTLPTTGGPVVTPHTPHPRNGPKIQTSQPGLLRDHVVRTQEPS